MQAKIYAQGHHNHYDDTQQHPSSGDSGQEEGSLASPFRQRPKATQHKAPASRASQTGPAGSRSTSRTEKGAARRVTSSKGNKALQGSTTSLAYASDSNAGLSKDELLERMADALRKERAKNKSYMKELQESELEVRGLR